MGHIFTSRHSNLEVNFGYVNVLLGIGGFGIFWPKPVKLRGVLLRVLFAPSIELLQLFLTVVHEAGTYCRHSAQVFSTENTLLANISHTYSIHCYALTYSGLYTSCGFPVLLSVLHDAVL